MVSPILHGSYSSAVQGTNENDMNIVNEIKDQDGRRGNLIVYNLPESTQSSSERAEAGFKRVETIVQDKLLIPDIWVMKVAI